MVSRTRVSISLATWLSLGVVLRSHDDFLRVFRRLSVVFQLGVRLVNREADFTLEDLGRRLLLRRLSVWVEVLAAALVTGRVGRTILVLTLRSLLLLFFVDRVLTLLVPLRTVLVGLSILSTLVVVLSAFGRGDKLIVASRPLVLAQFFVVHEDFATDLAGALLRVPSVVQMAVKRDLARKELLTTGVAVGRCGLLGLHWQGLLLLHRLALLQLLLWSTLHLILRRLDLTERDEAEVDLAGSDFASLRVLFLDMTQKASLTLERPLAGAALVDGWSTHLLVVLVSWLLLASLAARVFADLRVVGRRKGVVHLLPVAHHLVLISTLWLLLHKIINDRSALRLLGLRAVGSRAEKVVIIHELLLGTHGHFLLAGLLSGSLSALGARVLVEVVGANHPSVLLLWLALASLANWLVEMASLALVLGHLLMGVEPSVALDHMVVCRKSGLEPAEEDMVGLELMVPQNAQVGIPIAALRAHELGNLALVAATLCLLAGHVGHLVVVVLLSLHVWLLVHHLSAIIA